MTDSIWVGGFQNLTGKIHCRLFWYRFAHFYRSSVDFTFSVFTDIIRGDFGREFQFQVRKIIFEIFCNLKNSSNSLLITRKIIWRKIIEFKKFYDLLYSIPHPLFSFSLPPSYTLSSKSGCGLQKAFLYFLLTLDPTSLSCECFKMAKIFRHPTKLGAWRWEGEGEFVAVKYSTTWRYAVHTSRIFFPIAKQILRTINMLDSRYNCLWF